MLEPITVLSLFDGMSCGQIALQRLGIKVKNYFASEVDKHAIKVTMANFPNTGQLGDVTQVRAENLPKIDLLIGGSPCQGFSFAGKGLNFNDPRSKLIFEFVRLLRELKPKYFLLENVRMKKEYELIISRELGVAPIMINSALVSAQNRERLYWTNIMLVNQGLFGNPICAIPQPKDKGILLKDILESEVAEKYYLKDKMLDAIMGKNPDKSYCIDANYAKGTTVKRYKEKHQRQLVSVGGNHSDIDLSVVQKNEYGCIKFGRTEEAKAIRRKNMAKGKDYSPFQAKKINYIDFYKMNTITASGYKDNLLAKPIQLNLSIESGGKQPFQQNRVYDEQGKMIALDTDQRKNVLQNYRIRRLTPLECERLQTVDDGYTAIANTSDTQRYKMLGNGWTVEVICHIFKYMNTNN